MQVIMLLERHSKYNAIKWYKLLIMMLHIVGHCKLCWHNFENTGTEELRII